MARRAPARCRRPGTRRTVWGVQWHPEVDEAAVPGLARGRQRRPGSCRGDPGRPGALGRRAGRGLASAGRPLRRARRGPTAGLGGQVHGRLRGRSPGAGHGQGAAHRSGPGRAARRRRPAVFAPPSWSPAAPASRSSRSISSISSGVAGREHAAAEHHVDRLVEDVEAAHGGEREGHDLLGLTSYDRFGRRVAVGGDRRTAPASAPGTGPRRSRRGARPRSARPWSRARSGRAAPCGGAVSGPRPSSARAAHHMRLLPEAPPPPQSPEMWPTAAKRAVLPSGSRPEQLMPAPQTTATPRGSSTPGPQDGEGVVEDLARARPTPGRDGVLERLLLERAGRRWRGRRRRGRTSGPASPVTRPASAQAASDDRGQPRHGRLGADPVRQEAARRGRCRPAGRRSRSARRRSCCCRRRWRGRPPGARSLGHLRPTAGRRGCGRSAGP